MTAVGSPLPTVATRELRTLSAVQAALAARPGVLAAARGLSHFGEHALGWVAIAGVGAVVDRSRRAQWGSVAVGAVGAHAASIVIKRVVRRPRPDHPSVSVGVGTPSKLSFPSSHAASTAAAAVLMGRLTGLPLPALLIPPMLLSRLVLGVHYPTDVLAGAALGVGSASALLLMQNRCGLPGGDR
ncbi:MAG: phosphatase PAP2 family protein [Mycobacteriaceae bacterium]